MVDKDEARRSSAWIPQSHREPTASTSWWCTSLMRTQKSVLVAVVLSVSVLSRVQLIATHGSYVHGISPARLLE